MKVDLNSDLGESFGAYSIGNDDRVLEFVTSANVACGLHAGDPMVMRETVKMALDKGVAIGAHPGYPDLQGFGRRVMKLSPEEVKAYMIYQIGALKAFVEVAGGKLQHVKPHGALYNVAAKDEKIARAICEAVKAVDDELILVGLAGSFMISEGEKMGLPVANEVFADRGYDDEGYLIPRGTQGAMIEDKEQCINRVIKMVKEGKVTSVNGKEVDIKVDTICLHGDSDKAAIFAMELRKGLMAEGVELCPMGR